MNPIFSIGHSTHSADKLRQLLAAHQISAVADVRSSPYSRLNPQFNRETLCKNLRSGHISYVFLGTELGARTEDRSCYVEGRVQYDLLARTSLFQQGLDRACRGAETHRIALLCAEKEPLECHRCILVSRHLVARGADVRHILQDGVLESHGDTVARLLRELRLEERELFRSHEDLVLEAYRRRGDEIGYVEPAAPDKRVRGMAR